MLTWLPSRDERRSQRSQAPSPKPDHRVPRLLSTVRLATLAPSAVLAVTAEAGGVTSWAIGVGVGVMAEAIPGRRKTVQAARARRVRLFMARGSGARRFE